MTTLAHNSAVVARPARADALSRRAQRVLERTEGGPTLMNDWLRAVFVHYEVAPRALQPLVPFDLDLRDGRAYISLVAFQMRRMRIASGGRLIEWLTAPFTAPISRHGFLNVRTYVKHAGETGIFFLAEWLANPLAVFLGPRTFGLPYRRGVLNYQHDHERGEVAGEVRPHGEGAAGLSLRYRAAVPPDAAFTPCEPGSLDAFLMERYTAFTHRKGVRRRFRVWHEPWPQTPTDIDLLDESLLALSGDWRRYAAFIGANYSPGVNDVWMGRPLCVNGRYCDQKWSG